MLLMLALLSAALTHSRGLDRQGCHTNRRTGDNHCHCGPQPRPPSPVRREATVLPLAPQPPAARPFRNCAEARAAGAAPVRRGDPGYGPHLDRDNDGVGCEPLRGRR
ncbi:MAG: excalibur calcium-binding domain-containing protein [Thermomonas sp.]